MNFFRKVIEWTDDSRDTLVFKYPVPTNGIVRKSKLTVREGQTAIFVYKGKIADIFEPGYYSLDTDILPILSEIKALAYGFKIPLTADVYFVNTKQFTNQKWGTMNPIPIRDKEFGMVRIKGYGSFSFKVGNSEIFLKELFGTNSSFKTDDINNFLKTIIISSLTDAVGESKVSVLDMAANTEEFNLLIKNKVQTKFDSMGLSLPQFYIENISVPKEVEEAIDKRSKFGIFADSTDIMMKVAASEAMVKGAENPGNGMMGAGMGLGAGMGMGQMMSDAFKTMNSSTNDKNVKTEKEDLVECPKCGAANKPTNKFCKECGAKMGLTCSCGAKITAKTKFCPECGKNLNDSGYVCECGAKLKPNAKFCEECGKPVK